VSHGDEVALGYRRHVLLELIAEREVATEP
jgi:hypothetical protein